MFLQIARDSCIEEALRLSSQDQLYEISPMEYPNLFKGQLLFSKKGSKSKLLKILDTQQLQTGIPGLSCNAIIVFRSHEQIFTSTIIDVGFFF